MSSHSYDTIGYEVDGHTATITLNRPEALNALSPHMITELRAAYDEAENDDDIWLMIVTGTGRAFCTGADVTEIPDDGKVIYERPYLSTYDQWEAPQEGTPPFRRMAKPVLAAINGICCGAGLDWVTTGDIVIASDKATFFDPHVSIGLVAAREMVRLARVLPRTVALRMALTGKHERMSAERAYELGVLFGEMFYDEPLTLSLIEAYYGSVTRQAVARVFVNRALADIKWASWAVVTRKISAWDFDYQKYGVWKYMRARDLLHDPRWDTWLREL